ncbi:hypothetical protein OIO90_006191 [Microbotryomycetes sp. JL221]|nr:hypothetical protein OIO90_006191 [Microbotryomycetes sp. JL221]
MGVVCSAIASVFAAIGRAITGLFSLIANFLNAIVRAITTQLSKSTNARPQQSVDNTPSPSSASSTRTTSTYLPPTTPLPGLPDNGIKINDIAIGVLPDWSTEGPMEINAALGAGVSIIGDYLNCYPTSDDLRQVDYHLPEILRIARGSVQPIYAPALIYHASLDTWPDSLTMAIANKFKMVNDQGIKVWLRLLFEMNGYWMEYGLQPGDFKKVWSDVTGAIRSQTNETWMFWSPNVWAGDVGDESQGYVPYWPGENLVDVVGLSYYWQGYRKSINQPPPTDQFKDLFKPFYDLLNPQNNKRNQLGLTKSFPIVIAETSAPYYYDLPTSSPIFNQPGDTDVPRQLTPNLTEWQPSLNQPPFEKSEDELYVKATWFVQLTSKSNSNEFPNLKAINLFNYLKRGGDEKNVLADFRSVGGNSSVEQWFRGYVGNQTAYELGYTGTAAARHVVNVYVLALVFIFIGFIVL